MDQEELQALHSPSTEEGIATLYKAALAADDAFRKQLVRVYGERNASTARYKFHHDDPTVQAAADAKVAADRALLEARANHGKMSASLGADEGPACQQNRVFTGFGQYEIQPVVELDDGHGGGTYFEACSTLTEAQAYKGHEGFVALRYGLYGRNAHDSEACWIADYDTSEIAASMLESILGHPVHSSPDKVVEARELAASGHEAAKQFFEELLDSVETLGGIAEAYGVPTLANLMYLHQAILTGTCIDNLGENSVLDVLSSLPSGERWKSFVKANEPNSSPSLGM